MFLRHLICLAASIALFCATAQHVRAADEGLALSVGARYHTDHSAYEDLPFGTSDISYVLALEYAERIALWQLGVDIAPYLSGKRKAASDGSDSVVPDPKFAATPQLNLIFKDRTFRGGAGILGSYIRDDEDNSEWIGPYWQLMLGLSFNLSKSVSLDGMAYYVMESWADIPEFGFGDLEYSLLLTFKF